MVFAIVLSGLVVIALAVSDRSQAHQRCTHGVSSIGPVFLKDGKVVGGDTTLPHTEACFLAPGGMDNQPLTLDGNPDRDSRRGQAFGGCRFMDMTEIEVFGRPSLPALHARGGRLRPSSPSCVSFFSGAAGKSAAASI